MVIKFVGIITGFIAFIGGLFVPPLQVQQPTTARSQTPSIQIEKLPASTTPVQIAPKHSPIVFKKSPPQGGTSIVNIPKKTVSTPMPLVVTVLSASSTPILPHLTTASSAILSLGAPDSPSAVGLLNARDIIVLTNNERIKQGLPALTYNRQLSAQAEGKAIDMINKQYFAHVSPEGIGLEQLVEKYGYKYLDIGENLALGDFASSSHVVNGWMNSPGHRANILNKDFTEIGVSAIEEKWEGRIVWFAVQEFGKPFPDCTEPDPNARVHIETMQKLIDTEALLLQHMRKELDSGTLSRDAYNAEVADYNIKVGEYNALIVDVKGEIDSFNIVVHAYNACVGV